MRVPIGQRAVGLDRGHHADREMALAHGGPGKAMIVRAATREESPSRARW